MSFTLPERMSPGTKGQRIRVQCNLVPVNLKSTTDAVYVYDVKFVPAVLNRVVRAALMADLKRMLPDAASLAYDGTAMGYSLTRITKSAALPLTIEIRDPKFLGMEIREKEATTDVVKKARVESNFDKTVKSLQAAAAPARKAPSTDSRDNRPASGSAASGAPAAAPAAAASATAVVEEPPVSEALDPEAGPSAGASADGDDADVSAVAGKKFHVRITLHEVKVLSLQDISAYLSALSAGARVAVQTAAARYPAEALSALEVIIASSLADSYKQPLRLGSSVFDLSRLKDAPHLGHGAKLLSGVFQAPRVATGGIFLNVDTTHVDLIAPAPLLNYLLDVTDSRDVRDLAHVQPTELAAKLNGLRVETTHRIRRRYTLCGVGAAADKHMITTPEGVTLSVAAYFNKTYPGSVRSPELPVVTTSKANVVLPIEVLRVLDGQRVSTLSTKQRIELINNTCAPPTERLAAAAARAEEVARVPALSRAGIAITARLHETTARQLPQLTMMMGAAKPPPTPSTGVWNPVRQRFAAITREVKSPVIITVTPRADDALVKDVLQKLGDAARAAGTAIAAATKRFACRSALEVEETLAALNPVPDFVFGFCNPSDPSYNVIKRVCELQLGVPSQCFNVAKAGNQRLANDTYFTNVMLKINAKLGGVNFHAPKALPALLRSKPTLVLGADVFHDGGMDGLLSHSAITGSRNAAATQYGGVVQQQARRLECIPAQNVERAAGFLVREFAKSTKQKPGRIVYFRDGVADQQIVRLLQEEVAAIAAACTAIEPGYEPEIACVTAVKRHHLRFHGQQGLDRSGNLQCGTVVDTDIVRPDLSEFYLYGHAGLKGTSRPCLYQIVCNTTSGTMDDFQELAFYLSHLHQRAARTVSLPVPVYYAHLLAYRARIYAERYSARGGGAPEWAADARLKQALYGVPYYL